MYLEEKTIKGVKHYRTSPWGTWRPKNETHTFIKTEEVKTCLNEKEMTDIEKIDSFIDRLKSIKQSMKKKEKLSDKAFNLRCGTPRQFQKVNTALNWECMNLDKSITDFAREFKGSLLDVDTGEKTYNPSGFHNYKH